MVILKIFSFWVQFSSVTQSYQTLRPHGLHHTRLPCPSPAPGAYLNSCPLSWWCHPTISSCCPLLLLPSIFPSVRVFSNESVFHIRWPKYWSFSFSISPSNEYSGLISFRMFLKEPPYYSLCICMAGDEWGEIELWRLRAEVEGLQDTGQGTVQKSFFLHILKEVLHPPLSLLSPPVSW